MNAARDDRAQGRALSVAPRRLIHIPNSGEVRVVQGRACQAHQALAPAAHADPTETPARTGDRPEPLARAIVVRLVAGWAQAPPGQAGGVTRAGTKKKPIRLRHLRRAQIHVTRVQGTLARATGAHRPATPAMAKTTIRRSRLIARWRPAEAICCRLTPR